MAKPSEQERGEWASAIPEDGEQCPDCHHGVLEVQTFGGQDHPDYEVHAWCVGLNGVKQEDADEDEADSCGCGWSGLYKPNQTHNDH